MVLLCAVGKLRASAIKALFDGAFWRCEVGVLCASGLLGGWGLGFGKRERGLWVRGVKAR